MRDTIPASADTEPAVPSTCRTLPPTTATRLCPAAEISGKPLLLVSTQIGRRRTCRLFDSTASCSLRTVVS